MCVPNQVVGRSADAYEKKLGLRLERFTLSQGVHTQARDSRIAAVETFIIRNLARRVTLTELARVACLEKHYLTTVFKRETGQTIGNWQRSRRVERAISLLANRRILIAEIAQAVGYQDTTSLERAFRSCVDATPREVRCTMLTISRR